MRVKNNSVPNQPVILLNPKDDLPPDGAPISYEDSSDCDYFVEIPHSESEGYLFEDVAPAAQRIKRETGKAKATPRATGASKEQFCSKSVYHST